MKVPVPDFTEDVRYQVRVSLPRDDGDPTLVKLSDYQESDLEVRKKWIKAVFEYIWTPESNTDQMKIRPLNLLLHIDGSVESKPFPTGYEVADRSNNTYPANYRIPPESIIGLSQREQIERKEMFAFGSLVYEIVSGKKPFEWFSADDV